MKDILFIDACVRPESRTRYLAEEVLRKLDGKVTRLDLYKEDLRPLDLDTLSRRNELSAAGNFEDPVFRYAKQFAAAEKIVMAAPYWDLSFPSILKVYMEHISVVGITFRYDENGIPRGLCSADSLIYLVTAGGPIYQNLGYEYVKAVCEVFYGISPIRCFSAEDLDVIGADTERILGEAVQKIREAVI